MQKWVEILNAVECQSSTNKKKELLEIGINAYPELEKLLRLSFVSNKILNLDSKTIEKSIGIETKQLFKDIGEKIQWYLNNNLSNKSLIDIGNNKTKTFDDFIELYNNLLENRGMLTKTYLNKFFMNCDKDDAKWYARCLVKDLSAKVSIQTINKVLIKCDKKPINKFSLQLAVALGNDNIKEKLQNILNENNGEAYCENKEDGIRMCVRNTQGFIEALSRNGKPILNVDNILYECKRIFGDTKFELDGELIAKDFYSLTTTIHRKNDTQTIIPRTFQVFDITYFNEDISNWKYIDRRQLLMNFEDKSDIIKVVDMKCFNNVEDILSYFDKQVKKGEEGIIIKTNKPYTRKREFWYKLKPVHTLDLKIIGFEYADKGEYVGKRNVLIVSDKNGKLISKVGSGLKESDIELFTMGEEKDWIGKIVEVKFDSITPMNKNGVKSLRFPRFIKLRDDKDIVDTIE